MVCSFEIVGVTGDWTNILLKGSFYASAHLNDTGEH